MTRSDELPSLEIKTNTKGELKPARADTSAYEIRYITEEEAAGKAAERKASLGFFYLEDVESFTFPTYFTAAFYYSATGEGSTIGITMARATNADDLRKIVNEELGAFYLPGVEVWPSLLAPEGYASLVPELVRTLIDPSIDGRYPATFRYTGVCHVNMA